MITKPQAEAIRYKEIDERARAVQRRLCSMRAMDAMDAMDATVARGEGRTMLHLAGHWRCSRMIFGRSSPPTCGLPLPG